MKKRVVITGLGVVSPIGIGKDAYADSLRNGRSGVGLISVFDTAQYPTKFAACINNFKIEDFGIDRKKARHMARFTQLGVSAATMALTDSGLDLNKVDKSKVSVITGSGIGGIEVIEEEETNLVLKGPRRVSPFLIPMMITNMLPGEIAIKYGFTGPNYSVSSACASGNNAIGDALRILRYGDADIAIAGGSEAAITPLGLAGFCNIKALSERNDAPEKASRPFDKNRDGFVMGEGSGMFVLETLDHAKKRGAKIYAELAGYGSSDDAYHVTAPSPGGDAPAQAMRMAIEDGDIKYEEVDYINAHGTSTPFNDKAETLAIKKVFGERAYKIPISSTKSMTGHLLGAAGGIELAAIIVCMEKGFIHPTINYETPDPECDLDYVPNKAREAKINCALSNSLGFGGHNATLAVKRYVE